MPVTAHQIYLNDINEQLTEQEKADLIRVIEHQLAFHKQTLEIPDPLFVPIKIFPRENQYNAYRGKGMRAAGHFSPIVREVALHKEQDYMSTLFHEAQHLVFFAGLKYRAKWLNEGLSEVYESVEFQGDQLVSKIHPKKLELLKGWLQNGELPALESYFSLSRDSWTSLVYKPERISYTMAWGVVYFLMSSEQGRKAIRDTIKYTSEKDHSFQGIIYPGDVEALDREFRAFIGHMPQELVL